VNGRLVTDVAGAVQASADPSVSREAYRFVYEQRFTCERMLDASEQMYERL